MTQDITSAQSTLRALGPYATAAKLWRSAGWLGVLPVTGKDTNIPSGFTGNRGVWPSGDQILQWIERRGSDNLVVRLPKDDIGIDVDAYDGKEGLQTLEHFEQLFGELPPTYISTSRTDGSGIRLFRVPENVHWVSDLGKESNVEIIRFGHRYIVAWPSIHPLTSSQYQIWLPIHETTQQPPRVEHLTPLPPEWVNGLTRVQRATHFDLGSVGARSDAVVTGQSEITEARRVDSELMLLLGAQAGEQDELLYRYLCSLRARNMSSQEAITLGMVAISRMENSRPDDPWTPEHVAEKVHRIWATHPAGTSLQQSLSTVARAWVAGAAAPEDRPALYVVRDGSQNGSQNGSGSASTASVASWEGLPPDATEQGEPGDAADGPESPTDTGNSDRFARLYAKTKLRYIPETREWHVWSGQRWRVDLHNEAYHLTRFVADDIRQTALDAHATQRDAEDDPGERWAAWALMSESESKRTAMLKNATADPRFIVSAAELDTNPNLIACENGVIELLTSRQADGRYWCFRSGTPADALTQNTNYEFDPEARSEDWETFITYAHPNTEVRTYLQALDGYTLFGANPLRYWIILKGGTATGKSTHMELIGSALGNYSSAVNLSIFRNNHDDKPRADIVNALPCRRIHLSEIEREVHLHSDQVKRMTGGELITARTLYSRTQISKVPAFTPVTAMNGSPTIEAADKALNQRIVTVPFTVSIDADPTGNMYNVVFRLRMNPPRSPILRWLLDGWDLYQQGALNASVHAMNELKAEVTEDLSPIMRFVSEYCDVDADYCETVERLFVAFGCWESSEGVHARNRMTLTAFGLKMRDRFVKDRRRVHTSDGTVKQKTIYVGLRTKPEYEADIRTRALLKGLHI